MSDQRQVSKWLKRRLDRAFKTVFFRRGLVHTVATAVLVFKPTVATGLLDIVP